jgi:hypothetical protein
MADDSGRPAAVVMILTVGMLTSRDAGALRFYVFAAFGG